MKRLHPPKLVPGETVIWLCGYKIYLKQLTNPGSVLCADEQLYSPCLRQHNNRVGCIVIYPALFHLLAECMSSPFCQFARSGFVKPRLPASDSTAVNFSDTGGFALIALSAKSEIGKAIDHCYGNGWAEITAWNIESPTHRSRVYINKSA